jgi:hypothetical protein
LSDEEIATLHKFLGAMPQEARKRFTIEFRHHFQVPRTVRTIKDRITQRRHKDFIDVFERELAGGTPCASAAAPTPDPSHGRSTAVTTCASACTAMSTGRCGSCRPSTS